jgi:acyl-CoA synthetase (AMP-forming)/AMP-acid ligase II
MASCVAPLSVGASTVILPKFERATFWSSVARYRPTFFSGVPAIYHLLLSDDDGPPDLSFLRFVVVGAAPVPAATITRFEQRFGVPMLQGYGLSETTVACNLTPLTGQRIAGTVGPPLPGIEVRVVDSRSKPVPTGYPGEVVVRGPIVMRGYLGRPDATAEVIRDGWLHTGDVGVMDDDGVLTIVDRTKDMIIRGGENIYPKEIEDVFVAMDGVLEVAVVGRPDAIMGEVPVAFVSFVAGGDRSPEALLEEARRILAPYKLPVEVVIESALPRNSVGKITKGVLRARLQAR